MLNMSSTKKLIFAAVFCCIGVVFAVDFATADAQVIRQLADKFVVSNDQQATFLSKAKSLVSLFSSATSVQRDDVIASIQDARYGGTMPNVQNDLDSLLATAKATPAGIKTNSPDGSSQSAANPQNIAVMSYLDRIASFARVLDSYRFKQVSEADKTQVMTLIQGLFDDRADSFADERQRLVQAIGNAKVLIFRDDATRKQALENFASQLFTQVPFDVQLAYQKRLYSNFSPLSADQKARVLRHFQEMAQMIPTLTDITLNNDFRDLLQFSDVAFFQDDPSSHSVITGLMSKVQALDPVFAQSYDAIISSLKASAPTLGSGDIQAFIGKVQTLVNMRYGNKTADLTNKSANAAALQDFLNYLIMLPPFSASVPQLTLWLGMVKADNITPASSKFIDRVNTYLSQDFMVQTNDATKRAAFMTNLATLMSSRYGSLPEELTADGISQAKQKLKQLLYWMTQISWFSDQATVLNGYLATIAADPATGPFSSTSTTPADTTTTASGTFLVSFGSEMGMQITQLEQSLSAIVSDNQKEMFMLSLFDVVQRKTAASPTDISRIGALITRARQNVTLGALFSSYCSFLQTGLNGSFDENARIQVYQDALARVANMSVVAEVIQTKLLDFIQYLVENYTRLTPNQVQVVASNISRIVSQRTFNATNLSELSDLYTELSMRISGGTGSTTSTSSTPTPTPTTQTSSTPGSSDNGTQRYTEQQKEQARNFFNARAWSMR